MRTAPFAILCGLQMHANDGGNNLPHKEFTEEFSSNLWNFIAVCSRVENKSNHMIDNSKLMAFIWLQNYLKWKKIEINTSATDIYFWVLSMRLIYNKQNGIFCVCKIGRIQNSGFRSWSTFYVESVWCKVCLNSHCLKIYISICENVSLLRLSDSVQSVCV